MRCIHFRALTDDQLRRQLAAGDIIFFVGRQFRLQEIEKQVERLGFGKDYIVSLTRGPNSDRAKIRLKPDACCHVSGFVPGTSQDAGINKARLGRHLRAAA